MDTKVTSKKSENIMDIIKDDAFKFNATRILLFLFFYVCLFLLNNSNTLILSLFKKSMIRSLDFVNLKIAISTFLLFFSAFEIKKINCRYKNILYLIIGGIVAYNIISGLVTSINILPFLLIYLYILLITFTTMMIKKFDFIMSLVYNAIMEIFPIYRWWFYEV
jgi:hypothetical protein